MKRFLCILMMISLLPLAGLAQGDELMARRVNLVWAQERTALSAADMTDLDDATAHMLKYGKTARLDAEVPEGEAVSHLHLRMDTLVEQVELQVQVGKNKYETVAAAADPGTEFLLTPSQPLTGSIRLVFTCEKAVRVKLMELCAYGEGQLPAHIRRWVKAEDADVLVVMDDLTHLDEEMMGKWMWSDKIIQVCVLDAGESPAAAADRLWMDGQHFQPVLGGDPVRTVTALTRKYRPQLIVALGDKAQSAAEMARQNAADYTYQLESAAENGLWLADMVATSMVEADALIASLGERDTSALRALCAEKAFAGALHADPAMIPYPAQRLEDGYLAEGEFLYEDEDNGLWAYLSQTVQVEIVRYTVPEDKAMWYITDVRFKPETERIQQVVYSKATFKDQQTYPQTLAQNAGLVLGFNGDYYPHRADKNQAVGNVLRNYKTLYNYEGKIRTAFPNLDTAALKDDGSMEVFAAHETTASALEARGDVHDALSFGPYLARNGRIRIYDGKNWDATEPRSALGMVSPGHYKHIMVEGRIPNGPKGINLNNLSLMMYSLGVNEAFNLDGGSTAVLIFMGEKLNRTGKGNSVGSPRNMHELFGVGTSTLVHTEWLNGKPKK